MLHVRGGSVVASALAVALVIPSSLLVPMVVVPAAVHLMVIGQGGGAAAATPQQQQQQLPKYADSFDGTATEYDFTILDPHSVHGSPYGGFSRATRSALASLPLHLPQVSRDAALADEEDSSRMYMQVRDDEGRLFACRVYHEDELDPASLDESMFDAPKLRSQEQAAAAAASNGAATGTATTLSHSEVMLALAKATQPSTAARAVPQKNDLKARSRGLASDAPAGSGQGVNNNNNQHRTATENAPKQAAPGAKTAVPQGNADRTRGNNSAKLFLIEKQLQELQGICGQVHLGWWSYEWCFEQGITQYHIEYDPAKNNVQVEQVTNLGTFHSRKTQVNLQNLPPNEWAEDTPELARVVDFHDGGTICEETGKPRKSFVHLQCCSGKVASRRKGMLHRDGHPVASDVAALLEVHEDSEEVCLYNVTVCTPLLCGEEDDDDGSSKGGDGTAAAAAGSDGVVEDGSAAIDGDIQEEEDEISKRILSVLNQLSDTRPNDDESLRDILDRTLAKLCLQTATGGWWIYEYCHKQQIRQFHQVTVVRQSNTQGGGARASKVIETEHVLGRYNPSAIASEEIPDEEEWKLVVNATADSKLFGDGNGAYYEVEYTGGDVCDHSDVTESAIVAGSVGAERGVERASTVRFYCGVDFGISVSEDHTCHYIVKVKLPGLCGHPLFRAPVSKKQIIKCLPIEE